MINLIGTKHNPVNVWTNDIDVYTELTVVDQNEKAVKFDNGDSARLVNGKIKGYRLIK